MSVSSHHFAALAVATCKRMACRPLPSAGRPPNHARKIDVKRVLLAMASCLSIGAHATLVDFSGVPLGNNPNPLEVSGATFTTLGGFNFVAGAEREALCPSLSNTDAFNCSRNLEVGFIGGASNISFEFRANNNHVVGADIGDVEIFSGNDLLGILNVVVADDLGSTLDPVNLASFSNVTRIVISSTDFGGVLYDNFRFDPGNSVPEPATWLLVLAAAGLGAGAGRRRRNLAVTLPPN